MLFWILRVVSACLLLVILFVFCCVVLTLNLMDAEKLNFMVYCPEIFSFFAAEINTISVKLQRLLTAFV